MPSSTGLTRLGSKPRPCAKLSTAGAILDPDEHVLPTIKEIEFALKRAIY
jgi:hypothetical protein